MKHVSFLCEHSVEYVLVQDIVKTLSREYECVIPLFFWATREGTHIASKGLGCRPVRLVTAYARRPKIQDPHDTAILMKVNAPLFHAAESGLSVGSPVFAGVPLASNLLQFTMSTPCSWFQLHKPSNGVKDVEIQLALDGSRVGSEPACPAIEGPLTGDGILSIVRSKARPISWEAAFEGMRLIKIQGGYGQRWFFTPGYKPFYLIIPS